MDSSNYILTLDKVSKFFPGVKALNEVSFGVERGKVHALCGENGAGKSTLIKIIAGINLDYGGEIIFEGSPFHVRTPADAQKCGISVVHQELKLVETLTVTENIFLGNPILKRGLIDWKEMRIRAKQMVEDLGMDIDVNEEVENLTVAKKQIVEICKAMNKQCRVLIMDEPSATLTDKELNILFDIIARLKNQGVTIIYISHKLDEIFKICQNVTVLRDGMHIKTMPLEGVTRQELITLMVGREMGLEYPKEVIPLGDVVLEVASLSSKGVFNDISFSLRKGEVLGISGLVGSGRTELMRGILGIDKISSGTIKLNGQEIHNKNFRQAINRGFGLIPEDRKTQGLIQILPVKENTCMVNMDKIIRGGIIVDRLEKEYTLEYVDKLNIILTSIYSEVQFLSGGNQQKVVIAKWLIQDSDIIIMDEPTRGIDVGAKSEIYRLINALVKSGKSVIMISSELPEIIGMSDRVLVMHEGRCTGHLSREELSQEKIMSLCV